MSGSNSGTGNQGNSVGQHGPTASSVGQHGPTVTNQGLLVLPNSVFDCLQEPQLHALKIIQLEFSRDVSAAATIAYEKIIAEFRRTDAPSRIAD
jgi:hypothetical protein